MGVRNPNSTGYEHPDEPNLLNLHKTMQYNSDGEPVARVHVDGINLQGDVIIDKVKVEVNSARNTISPTTPVSVSRDDTPNTLSLIHI